MIARQLPFERICAALEIKDQQEREHALKQLSPSVVRAEVAKVAPKLHGAPWETGTSGEAGNFVEVRSRGGIVGFSESKEKGKL